MDNWVKREQKQGKNPLWDLMQNLGNEGGENTQMNQKAQHSGSGVLFFFFLHSTLLSLPLSLLTSLYRCLGICGLMKLAHFLKSVWF